MVQIPRTVFVVIVLAFLLGIPNVNASLITTGDILYDTTANLYWDPLATGALWNSTYNGTYSGLLAAIAALNDPSNLLGGLTTWHLATPGEMLTLMANPLGSVVNNFENLNVSGCCTWAIGRYDDGIDNGTNPTWYELSDLEYANTGPGVTGYYTYSRGSNIFGTVSDTVQVPPNALGAWVVASVPEPSTMFLLGSGLIGLWGFRRNFKK